MRQRRFLCLWFPRFSSDRLLRGQPMGPFAVVARAGNADRLACLNPAAEQAGLSPGMGLADARALCPDLSTAPAAPERDAVFLQALQRWAGRFSPLVGRDGADGLVLDIAGAAHLFGGEEAMRADLLARLERAGIEALAGLGDTRGIAWALAHYGGGGLAAPGQGLAAIGHLPPEALRLDPDTAAGLHRLGLRRLRDLADLPRATLARRFGPGVTLRLDQALGGVAEPVSPDPAPAHFAVRLTFPDPIGLLEDVRAGLGRLLERLCQRLAEAHRGARILRLECARVDRSAVVHEVRLARPMREPEAIAGVLVHRLTEIDAGYGIDRMRLVAVLSESLPPRQIRRRADSAPDRLADLVSRLIGRLGDLALERMDPADSHVPERAVIIHAAAFAPPADRRWAPGAPRPATLFPPEPVTPPLPGRRFVWRGVTLAGIRFDGPERIAPEWWFDDPGWRSGPRDYWHVESAEGPRLWAFRAAANDSWAIEGECA